ncbi:hypothetical protein NRY68_05840 [Acidithiobacillus ferrooxidans]|uniref:hypothetical protein n=1 Tax=Acidithiobacillus ferrooxidans TaxID=920 RepID=UPI002148C26F|nr:hypothetical protein [Acidithiobacillus ferrooxidans]MCR1345328.1 hypothetical protein [Acidithiobacillus ferrooxidans]MCR1354488.1 hypothetical protein [Acidithiobacillus ferrooxidans]
MIMVLYICMSRDFKRLLISHETPKYNHDYWGDIHGCFQGKMNFSPSVSSYISGKLESIFPNGWQQIVPAVRIETEARDGDVLGAITSDLGNATLKYFSEAESVVRKTLKSFDQNAAYGIFPADEISLRILEKQAIARLSPSPNAPWAF